jgi:hypothetical protein
MTLDAVVPDFTPRKRDRTRRPLLRSPAARVLRGAAPGAFPALPSRSLVLRPSRASGEAAKTRAILSAP